MDTTNHRPGDASRQRETSPPTATPHDALHEAPRVLLTVEAAAERLSISRTRMYALIKTGEVTSVRVGRLRRIPTTALDTFTTQLITTQHAA